MARAVMRRLAIAASALGVAIAAPASAQLFSEGYEFLEAVEERDGQAVTAALNEPGNVLINSRDITSGQTALHIVTARRDSVWVRFLTQRGANPNIKDKRGVAPLQLAVTLGDEDSVAALIKAGANLNITDSSGETPLIAAVHRRNVPILRLLLEKGANPDRTDNSGRSAREYAELMTGNKRVLDEFTRADEAKAGAGETRDYGPSF
ncbi:MAG: ankyrin repeat domain-containing protein [Erythrobacter sp.]